MRGSQQHIPNYQSYGRGRSPGRSVPVHRALQIAVVVACGIGSLLWVTSQRDSHADSVNTPAALGQPSPSIVAAVETVTSGGVNLGQSGSNVLVVAGVETISPDSPDEQSITNTTADAVSGDAVSGDSPTGNAAAMAIDMATITRPTRTFAAYSPDRLTTDKLVARVQDNNITNVADFLSALPAYMGGSFTLTASQESRHLASLEFPRIIMYGPDARLLIGVSSHPADPLREVAEVAELDATTGIWRFSQFDFRNAFVHDTNPDTCSGCHGEPSRPIWGSYPDWPGAYDDALTGAQAARMMELKADPLDRFHALAFPSDRAIVTNNTFDLAERSYGFANTSFNFELNAAVADGIARRILRHSNWASDRYDLMFEQWQCESSGGYAELDRLYNRFGVDGNNDFNLSVPAFDATADVKDEYRNWYTGATRLFTTVAFRTLDLAARQDSDLAAITAIDPRFARMSHSSFEIIGAERADYVRQETVWLQPQNLSDEFRAELCRYLGTRGG